MTSPVKAAKQKHQAAGFTEIAERGRGYLRSRKPGTNQFALTTQVGNRGWHRGNGPYTEADEVDTAWVQTGPNTYEMLLGDPFEAELNLAQQSYRYTDMDSRESVELFAESVLEWVNDSGDRETAAGLSSPIINVNDDTITFEDLFGVGTRLAVQAQTARLRKLLTLDNAGTLSIPTLTGTVYLSVPLRFQRSNGVTIWIDGAEWDEKANNPQTTTGTVEFRNAGGQTLFGFKVPRATDDSTGENYSVDGLMHLRKTGANLWVEVRIPKTWIDGATFPIMIDPTLDDQVGASGDDGNGKSGNSTIEATGNSIINGYHTVASIHYRDIWALFTSISGLSGATINADTYIELDITSTASIAKLISVEDAAAPAAPTDYSDFSGKTRTTANTAYTGAGAADPVQINLQSSIQELADSYDPSSIQVLADDNGQSTASAAQESYVSYDLSTTDAPKLHIDYTAAGGGDPAVSKSESVSVSDTPAVSIQTEIVESESVSLTDTPKALLVSDIAESESVSVSDSPTVYVQTDIVASESVAVTDTPTLDIQLEIDRSESVAVADTPALTLVSDVAESESVSVADTPAILLVSNVTESEAVSVTDTPILDIQLEIVRSETITVTDTPTIAIEVEGDFAVSESESVSVSDSPVIQIQIEVVESESVGLADTPIVAVQEPDLLIAFSYDDLSRWKQGVKIVG